MKEDSKEKKSILFYIGIGLIGLLIIGVYLYCNVKGKIDDENGYNSINAIIALIALVVNIITIAFVYATYQTQRDTIIMQRKQIEDDKKDGDFNRVLDIISKQLEYTNKRYEFKRNISSANIKEYFASLFQLNLNKFESLFQPNTMIIEYLKVVIPFFSRELEVYYKVIHSNNLSDKDVEFFTSFFSNNIDAHLVSRFKLFQKHYRSFKLSENYKKANDLGHTKLLNSIEVNLNLILGYLKIPVYEDLDLGENNK